MRKLQGFSRSNPLKLSLSLLWAVLFMSGLFPYVGSKFVYVCFSILYLAMLLSGVSRQMGYGYLFLVIFLWLGFWFKLTASFLLAGWQPFIFEEPIGNFNGTPEAWDRVLWIAMCASIGVMLGRFLFNLLCPKFPGNVDRAKVPAWYPAIRAWLWLGVLVVTVGVALLNVYYGIHLIGLAPRTILPWPLNSLIAWMLNLGSALTIALLIWWDKGGNRSITLQQYAILGEAFLSAVSIISRLAFPLHSIPQVLALIGREEISRCYSRKQMLLFVVTFMVLFIASIAAVSFIRDYQYSVTKPSVMQEPQSGPDSMAGSIQSSPAVVARPVKMAPSFRLTLIHQLFVNRWIGMEGVMAVSSFPEKGASLFWKMLTEKREPGKVSAYQRVCNSEYQAADAKFQFASLPGAAAFFFYSGSLAIVILGMSMLSILIIGVERAILAITQNPLFCSLFGVTAANAVAQFGVTPRQDVPYFMLIVASAVLVWFLQSDLFASIIGKWYPELNRPRADRRLSA